MARAEKKNYDERTSTPPSKYTGDEYVPNANLDKGALKEKNFGPPHLFQKKARNADFVTMTVVTAFRRSWFQKAMDALLGT